MTEDVEGTCSLLNQSSHLATSVSVPSNCNTLVSQLDGTVYLNPNMMVEGSCLYTTADLAGTFPEGTVLQILPDSTILAVPPIKELTNAASNNTTIIFKDSSFATELAAAQNSSPVSTLLAESVDHNEPQATDVPICSEGNISDIDLSFLNEAVESVPVSSSKNFNETSMKDLQGMIAIVPPDSLEDVMQSNISNDVAENKEIQQSASDQPENPPEDVVMIDVSKPIQLSQNSLIMVNGQKCVLQHDAQTGQVIAYPVKEQEKPRRRRGRPRKSSIEQNSLEMSQNSETPPEAENASDEGKEKGLLEVVTDDGSLVRRSSRKRKKAKVLKDYETGNLKQELGSDVDDADIGEVDPELQSRRKKSKSLGRPRKFPPLPDKKLTEAPINNGVKRQRGRPRKQVPVSEPTQAFLVQTADGQTLMMQVPLSSIPQGLTLQEVAQNIANRLNLGLSQANNTGTDIGNLLQPLQKSIIDQNLQISSEPALQDHSIGSTTNSSSADQLQNIESAEISIDSSCPTTMTDVNNVIVDSACDPEVSKGILQNEDGLKSTSNRPESLLSENQTEFSNLEVARSSEENLPLNIPTSNSSLINNSSVLTSLPESFSDQISDSKPDDQDIEVSFSQFQIPKDFLMGGDFMKDKINLQQLLANVVNSSSDSQLADACIDQVSASAIKDGNSTAMQEFVLNESSTLKDFETEFSAQIVNSEKLNEEKQYIPEQSPELDTSEKDNKNYDFLTCDLTNSTLDSNMDKDALQSHSIISSIEHDHDLLAHSKPVSDDKTLSSEQRFEESKISTSGQAFQPILPLEKITSILSSTVSENGTTLSAPTATVVPVSSGQELELSEKFLPIILSPQELPGSKKCKVCQRPYFTEDEIIKHFKAEHPKCICNQCGYMADHAYVIKRHSIRHTEKVIACNICGKHYKDHYILKIHIKMVHLPAEVVFTCEICEKTFTRKAHLKRHLRIHAPHRPYKCSFCSYRGCEKSDITKHLLIHEAPKHKCHLCGKAFRHLKNKDLHLKRHFKQRDYKCGICNFYGYTFTDIRKHIERRHADIKPNSCTDCAEVFQSSQLLEEHKISGDCPAFSMEPKLDREDSVPAEGKETSVLEGMSLDILGESENLQDATSEVNTSSNEKIASLQPNQLILNSVDGVLNTQNGQIVISGLDGTDLLSAENLSFLSMANDSHKLITLVTSDGKNFTLPIKTEPFDGVLVKEENDSVDAFFPSELSLEIEDTS